MTQANEPRGPDEDDDGDGSSTRERIERMRARIPIAQTRYRIREEIGRGAMGVVLRAVDLDLGRSTAMKVIRENTTPPAPDTTTLDDDHVLLRFLDEAQITGQLEHPGIVPVHEIGLDRDGRAWFTMRLVKGQTAAEVFRLAKSNLDGWSLTRAVDVVIRVCDTLAYAHAKRVIHRDIKPSNVMVGRFGEVYVMDWGLAKVLGQRDRRDLRLRSAEITARSAVIPARAHGGVHDDTPVMTMDGHVVGTPCYMPPEQARGKLDEIDERADVYAVGGLLYTLLTGEKPYLPPGTMMSPYMVLAAVQAGPPTPIRKLAPTAPAALVAICDKAMARDLRTRYQSMAELAADLRAFLDDRVVHAYRTGSWAELRMWVRRNRWLAAMIAIAVTVAIAAGVVTTVFESSMREADHAFRAAIALPIDLEHAALEAESLLPWPEHAARLRSWLARWPEAIASSAATARGRAGSHDREVQAKLTDILDRVTRDIEGLRLELADRLEWAESVHDASIAAWEREWSDVCRDVRADPRYGGLELEPQLGMVPLFRDPDSGLFEFYDLRSSASPTVPERVDGRLDLAADAGIVWVLLPPARGARVGCQSRWPERPHYDPHSSHGEDVVEVDLDAFFVAKHELTRTQWAQLNRFAEKARREPSYYTAENSTAGPRNPVEQVGWEEARRVLARHGYDLPTEAQWEYACRAGTTTPWSCGTERATLQYFANVGDSSAKGYASEPLEPWSDGFAVHAPVGSLRANPFGLHDMHGNVAEWCADNHADRDENHGNFRLRPGDGRNELDPDDARVTRGGGFGSDATTCRSSHRLRQAVGYVDVTSGVRAVRRIVAN